MRVAGLLKAASTVFEEKGFEAATMTEIAARADAAIGSLYRFFPAKEALADALLDMYEEHVDRGFSEILGSVSGMSTEALAGALVDLMLDLRSDRAAAIELLNSRRDIHGRAARVRVAMKRQIAAILVASTDRLHTGRAEAMAAIILELMKGVLELMKKESKAVESLVAEMRGLIRLYIAENLGRRGSLPRRK